MESELKYCRTWIGSSDPEVGSNLLSLYALWLHSKKQRLNTDMKGGGEGAGIIFLLCQ